MPAKHSRRGRPKGSGLDDSGHLAAIAALISKDPDLKPTTAIKSLGISDPSTIRRLRDKYRAFKTGAEIHNPKLSHQPTRGANTVAKSPTPIATPTARPMNHNARQPRSPKPMEHASESLGEPASWLSAFCGLGLQAASTTVQIQSAALQHFMMFPPVAFAWRQQVTLNDLALSIYKNQKPLMMRPN